MMSFHCINVVFVGVFFILASNTLTGKTCDVVMMFCSFNGIVCLEKKRRVDCAQS